MFCFVRLLQTITKLMLGVALRKCFMCVFYRPRTFHPTITTFQYISHLVCRIDVLKSREDEHIHGKMPPWYKEVEIKYAHMIAKGYAAKHTLGAPRKTFKVFNF